MNDRARKSGSGVVTGVLLSRFGIQRCSCTSPPPLSFFSPGLTNAASDSATLSRPCMSITLSPLQMREYLAWKEAHSGRKSSAEKHAGIQLDEDDVDEEEDDDLSGDNEERGTDETGVVKGVEEEAREKRSYSVRENDGEQEWALEEEEVAARIEHRRVRIIRDVSFL